MAIKNIRNYISTIKYKLATAVSAGVVRGTTSLDSGHEHKFAVIYDDRAKMFWGKTSHDGQGGHCHWIAASVFDVMGPVERGDRDRENTEELIVPVTNIPANMKQLLDFYNKKEIVLEASPAGYPDEHTHTLVLRYAGAGGENNPNPLDSKNMNDGGSSRVV